MRSLKSIPLLLLGLAGTSFATADDQSATEKPYIHSSSTVLITAQVEAIDHETRVVMLSGPRGNMVTFTVGEEVRNLDQVAVGDFVDAEYVQSASIEVVANDGSEPSEGEALAITRAEEGEMPGAVAISSETMTAVIHEIDLTAGSVKLREADGSINEYFARDSENLKRTEVGDLVIVTYTEAIAISVEGKTE